MPPTKKIVSCLPVFIIASTSVIFYIDKYHILQKKCFEFKGETPKPETSKNKFSRPKKKKKKVDHQIQNLSHYYVNTFHLINYSCISRHNLKSNIKNQPILRMTVKCEQHFFKYPFVMLAQAYN